MTWNVSDTMDQRIRFVLDVQRAEFSKAQCCRRYGISRPTGDKWLERYSTGGPAAMIDLSRAPHQHPNQVPEELAAMIISLRKQYPRWGPKKLQVLIQRRYGGIVPPACSTIGEILRRAGLTAPRRKRHRTPPYTQPFGDCNASNDVWCIDFKGHFTTGDGRRCDPLTITDAFSRHLLRVQAVEKTDGVTVWPLLEAAFREFGLPRAIRSDNGSPFASRALGGLSRLSVQWLMLGIQPERIEPGHPEQNGRHERMHRTLKAETANPPSPNLRAQQKAFDAFREEFNFVRPHEALGQRTPASVYTVSPREYLGPTEPDYGDHCEVRCVRRGGEIKWQGKRVYVSQLLAGLPVGLIQIGDRRWEVRFCEYLLGHLDGRRHRVNPIMNRKPQDATAIDPPFRCAPGRIDAGRNL